MYHRYRLSNFHHIDSGACLVVQQVFICFPLSYIGGEVGRSCDVRWYQLPQPVSRHSVSSIIATYYINWCIAGITSKPIAVCLQGLENTVLLRFACSSQRYSPTGCNNSVVLCLWSDPRGIWVDILHGSNKNSDNRIQVTTFIQVINPLLWNFSMILCQQFYSLVVPISPESQFIPTSLDIEILKAAVILSAVCRWIIRNQDLQRPVPFAPTLTHWGRDKMAAIYQTIFSNVFSWMKMYKFRLRFHWSLLPGVQLIIFQHWFR